MSEPQLQPPASDGESRVLEIEGTWEELSDEALEAALVEVRDLAASPTLRYGYQRRAHALAEHIDAQFDDAPEADEPEVDPVAE